MVCLKSSRHGINRPFQLSEHPGRPVSKTINRVRVRAAHAAEKPTLRVAVYSAQRYVHGFLKQPLFSAFPDSTMIEVFQHWCLYAGDICCHSRPQSALRMPQGRLDQHSATFASGHEAVCLFVNDDGSAPVSALTLARSVLYKAALPALCNSTIRALTNWLSTTACRLQVLKILADCGVSFIAMRCTSNLGSYIAWLVTLLCNSRHCGTSELTSTTAYFQVCWV